VDREPVGELREIGVGKRALADLEVARGVDDTCTGAAILPCYR
jgi:hypothetical protein